MRAAARVALLAVAFGLATVGIDWWTVPVLGGVWGLVAARETWPALTAAVAAGISWSLLLSWTAMRGPLLALSHKVSAVIGQPSWVLLAITVAFPMVLAGSAALLVGSMRRRGSRE